MNPEALLEPLLGRVIVVLSRPSHPGNIGSAARALKTMGLSRLTLVAPKIFPAPEAEALASGAADLLHAAKVTARLDDALGDATFSVAVSARVRDLGPAFLPVRAASEEIIARAARGETVALVFGNETAGLTNEEIQRCQRAAMIPANPAYASLNLAAAVQVLAYELRQSAFAAIAAGVPGTRATPFSSPPATHAEQEAFYRHLEEVMRASGFLDPERPGRLLAKLRRLFARAGLERDEINILRGLLATFRPPGS